MGTLRPLFVYSVSLALVLVLLGSEPAHAQRMRNTSMPTRPYPYPPLRPNFNPFNSGGGGLIGQGGFSGNQGFGSGQGGFSGDLPFMGGFGGGSLSFAGGGFGQPTIGFMGGIFGQLGQLGAGGGQLGVGGGLGQFGQLGVGGGFGQFGQLGTGGGQLGVGGGFGGGFGGGGTFAGSERGQGGGSGPAFGQLAENGSPGGGFGRRTVADLTGQGTPAAQTQPSAAYLAPAPAIVRASAFSTVAPTDRVLFSSESVQRLHPGFGPGYGRINYNRQTFAAEMTVLDGRGSVGVAVPLDNASAASGPGELGLGRTGVGDLTFNGKYVLWADPDGRGLLSGGLLVTAPINSLHLYKDNVFLQPYLGIAWTPCGPVFLQAFSSINVPTRSDFQPALFNDVQVGYTVYQNPDEEGLLRAVAPVLETHVTTPVGRGARGSDVVEVGGGVAVGLGCRSCFGLLLAAPVTGPRPYEYQVQSYLSLRY